VRGGSHFGEGEGSTLGPPPADLEESSRRSRELITSLARRRTALGLSQAEVARRMNTSQAAVARLESHRHDAQLSTLSRYAAALGLSVDFLLRDRLLGDDLEAGDSRAPAEDHQVNEPRRGDEVASQRGVARPDGEPGQEPQSGVLSVRQQLILDFIRKSVDHHGYSPSMREIADGVGLKSTAAVRYQLNVLVDKGYLTRDPRMPRTVVVEKQPRGRVLHDASDEAGMAPPGTGPQNMVSVPLFGQVAAGSPVTANPDPEGFIRLPSEMVGPGVLFAVHVVGDSMVNAGIFDGDYVIARQQETADNGDIVVALLGEEATVKTFHRVDGHVWLMPQSPGYEPIVGDHCHILGRVVAVIRKT
jgi:repressor LexA